MTKIEMLNKLEVCISIIKETENTFVRRTLEEVAEELVKQWSESDVYYEEIKQAINE